ncbi:hypothetical protein F9802_15560 [Bacillus aerolatus]|uniref:Uncharacterized protein n=1 Tax=Bacillus aerolatus TaxID=2653354 RepID=A0A6I1FME3_9BACI|nr:hypothetical protein [Bacillus aerolatus]KAB7704976.1 hypothetical protein F9802_15560 [Bacillus aerolatus]
MFITSKTLFIISGVLFTFLGCCSSFRTFSSRLRGIIHHFKQFVHDYAALFAISIPHSNEKSIGRLADAFFIVPLQWLALARPVQKVKEQPSSRSALCLYRG